MREIKFRAFFDDEMYPVTNLDYINDGSGIIAHIHVKGINQEIPSGQFELMQYTGLKDKNGVEIYEGDIIISDNSDIGGQRYKGVVEWNTDPILSEDSTFNRFDGLCFGLFIPSNWEGSRTSYPPVSGWLRCDFLGELEVIGNIFEGVDK